jgi:hypothetical protein
VEVAGKNDAVAWQDDPEFGEAATVARTETWTVDPAYTPPPPAPLVQISEVMAKNTESLDAGGLFPDAIELHNAGDAAADLSDWGLTDNSALPFKYIFPAGTTLAPGAYLVLHASSDPAVPEPKTGFALKSTGDTLTLTRSAAAGGGVADSVAFGAQLADYSIGRRPTDGAWDLCRPSFGAANQVARRDDASVVRINEWLASPGALFATDFLELYNPSTLPVDIGLGFLTDNPVEWPDRHQIRQLTFIAPGGFVLFKADGDPQDGPNHLNFHLSASQGEIGLFDPALALIDSIIYGPQTTGVSQGRSPNGDGDISFFFQPTPGGPNPGATNPDGVVATELIAVYADWKYMSSLADFQDQFQATDFDDSAWSTGGQLLYIEGSTLSSPSGFVKTTGVPGNSANSGRPFSTTYFRRHFSFSGSLTDLTLKATVMIDDGAVFYINGQEAARLRMGAGSVAYDTRSNASVSNAAEETITLATDALVAGDNVIAVEVHQTSGTSSDVVFGLRLQAEVPAGASATHVVLNELLVRNATLTNPDGSLAAWIELFNPSGESADLADMSLSDDVADPRRWVFPAGTTLAAGASMVLYCDPASPASATNTALDLDPLGDSVFLFDAPAIGGGLRDSVSFGQQLTDQTIGRIPNGTGAFTLNLPTFDGLNQAAALASASNLRLNEWLASASTGPDWFEIYNTAADPVLLGGHSLTDKLTEKSKHPVPPLTYVPGGGWLVFIADGNGAAPGHVNFSLKASGEEIGIFTAAGGQIDALAYGAQTSDVSEGRIPDGSATIAAMPPTPEAANAEFIQDSDGDGMPDDWETAHGFLPDDPDDALLDADSDGMTNLDEFIAGTDPHNHRSRLASTVGFDAAGRPLVSFTAVAGRSYTVEWSADLGGSWTPLTDIAAQTVDTEIEVADPAAAGLPRRFYRLVTPARE